MSIRIKNAFKLSVSALFLIFVICKVDFGVLAASARQVRPGHYILSLLLVFLNSTVLAQKYSLLMGPSGIRQTFAALFKINLICRFYAIFLPAALGQGVIRWYLSTRQQTGRINFLPVMLAERASFMAALLLAVWIPLQWRTAPAVAFLRQQLYPVVLLGFLAVALFYAFMCLAPMQQKLQQVIARHGSTSPWRGKTAAAAAAFSIYLRQYRLLAAALALAMVWHGVFLLRVYWLARSMGAPLGFWDVSWMASVVLFAQALPVSVGGLGVRETAYAVFFPWCGLPPEQGVLLGILFFSQMVLVAGVGGMVHLFAKEKSAVEKPV